MRGGAFEREMAGFADDGHELLRREDGLLLTALSDQSRDLRRIGFVSQIQKRIGQIALAHAVDQRMCRLATRRVHSHIQRPGLPVRKPAGRIINLRTGNAQVGQNTVHALDPVHRENRGQRREIAVVQVEFATDFLELLPRQFQIGRVHIQTDQPATRTDFPQQRGGMPAQSHRAIDDDIPSFRPKRLKHLSQQHRDMAHLSPHAPPHTRRTSFAPAQHCPLTVFVGTLNSHSGRQQEMDMSTQPANINRRRFLKSSLAASSIALSGLSFEEQALLAQQNQAATPAPAVQGQSFPAGKIGNVTISRLICGGNLISGFAHSRDLIYVSTFLRRYFADEKVHETLALCESQGLNTTILRLDKDTRRILTSYWKKPGAKIQWIAQIAIDERDLSDVKLAIDTGAVGVYTHGGVADRLVAAKKLDILAKFLDLARQNKVIAGIAGHQLAVPVACEQAGLNPDFYMKTFNSKEYWSAKHPEEHDNVWDLDPKGTREFMATVPRPWIAYKVLGAGAIHPSDGFSYAYRNGADFLCVGMFDFQVAEDVGLARKALEAAQTRNRPWRA